MALPRLTDYFPDWKEREALAEAMIPMIGKLYRKNVVIYCFGKAMYNQSVTGLMKMHRWVRQVGENELSEFETHRLLQEIAKLDLGPSHIDIGKLTLKSMELGLTNKDNAIAAFTAAELQEVIGRHVLPLAEPQDIVLYGFGRIGRLLARLLIEKTGGGQQLVLKAIVVRPGAKNDLLKRASLLRRDSIHGAFQGTIRIDEDHGCIIANGNVIYLIHSHDPGKIDYTDYGIKNALVIDNTGAWRDPAGLSRHLDSKGVAKVLLTAPGKEGVRNIVSGVNSHLVNAQENGVLATASCTTNAIVPVLKAVHEHYGIAHGHIETIHAYTPDQNLLDNFHKKNRRGRSAPLNLVLTQTGASSSVAELLPELAGKLTANAIRVPTPNVSLAMLHLTLEQNTNKEQLNHHLRYMALHSPMQRQIDYTRSPEVVSSDFVANRHACVIDSEATMSRDNRVAIYAWYDNEFGYSCQVIRVAQKWAGIKYPLIPSEIERTGF